METGRSRQDYAQEKEQISQVHLCRGLAREREAELTLQRPSHITIETSRVNGRVANSDNFEPVV